MRGGRQAWIPWAIAGVLSILCGVLAVLQYRWTGEISAAEQRELRESLSEKLDELRQAFNREIATAAFTLQPSDATIEAEGRERAYSAAYLAWKDSHPQVFRQIALAVPRQDDLDLYQMDLSSGQFARADWPSDWGGLHGQLLRRSEGGPPRPLPLETAAVFEVPRFGRGEDGFGREQEWLIVELNLDYLRTTMLPAYLTRYLGEAGKQEYDAEVVFASDSSKVVFQSGGRAIGGNADASVPLLDGGFSRGGRGPGGRRGGRGPQRGGPGFFGGPPRGRGFAIPPGDDGRGMLLLRVRHQAGSLENLVAQTRHRNLGVSAGILALILVSVLFLVRSSRQAQRLAEMQMNFVAGVSHELRTPLSVIGTAAFNLRRKLSHSPEQVERYGAVIEEQSARLGAMLEQILSLAGAQAGYAIRKRQDVSVNDLIERSLRAKEEMIRTSGTQVKVNASDGLPLLSADEAALGQALENLIDNAIRHGGGADQWIGIDATVPEAGRAEVEIAVTDHGAGIPPAEQKELFRAFFRGRRAIEEQVHGTGLGLHLVQRIVEAHGGRISVESEPGKGTAFRMRLPAVSSKTA